MKRDRISSIHDPRYRMLINELVQRREHAGLSQIDLAAILGLTQPDISKIERYERRIDVLELFDWLHATKSDIRDFAGFIQALFEKEKAKNVKR